MSKNLVIKISLIILFVCTSFFVRTYNIEQTARFTQDESSDLVRMHQYFAEKKITLVGPISNDKTKVFSSLTYYMLMPFAAATDFDPIGAVYGTAFYGVLTALMLLYLTYLINKKYIWWVGGLTIIWYPLLETSRWAWNPHLIPFWVALALLLYKLGGRVKLFASGLSLGMGMHHHYLTFFDIAGYSLWVGLTGLWQRRYLRVVLFAGGVLLALLPFLLFDLKNPPGLFFTTYLQPSSLTSSSTNLGIPSSPIEKLGDVFYAFMYYMSQNMYLAVLLGAGTFYLLVWDFIYRKGNYEYALPWIFQVLGVVFVGDVFNRYVLPGVVFYLIWLIGHREKDYFVPKVILGILIMSGVLSVYPQLTTYDWHDNIYSVRDASNKIKQASDERGLKDVNVLVLGDWDRDPSGTKYHDLLTVKGMNLKLPGDFKQTQNIFVVSQTTPEKIMQDPVYKFYFDDKSELVTESPISGSTSRLYLFKRD